MPEKKGFTLIEIIVVLVILGGLAAIAIPSYSTYTQQGAAKAAQNNLITIYNAQKNYYFSNGTYCVSSNGVCNSSASVNSNLSLNITDTNFTYTCTNNPFNPFVADFICYATNNGDSNFLLTLTGSNPIVLPGGTPPLNPSCQDPENPTYCPS